MSPNPISQVVRLLLAILAVVFLAEEVATAGESVHDEPFYQQITRAVISLEDGKTGQRQGTAFFVYHGQDNQHYYLVTARHVVAPRTP